MLFIRTSPGPAALLAVAGGRRAAKEARVSFVSVFASSDGAIAVTMAAASSSQIVVLETTHLNDASRTSLKELVARKRQTIVGFGNLDSLPMLSVGTNGTAVGAGIMKALAPPRNITIVCVKHLDIFNLFASEVCEAVRSLHGGGGFEVANLDTSSGATPAAANLAATIAKIAPDALDQIHVVSIGTEVTQILLAQPWARARFVGRTGSNAIVPTLLVVQPGAEEAVEFARGPERSRIHVLVDTADYSQGYAATHSAIFYDRTKNRVVTTGMSFGPIIYTKASQLPPRYICALQMQDYVMCATPTSQQQQQKTTATTTEAETPSTVVFPAGCSCVNTTAFRITAVVHGNPTGSQFWNINKLAFESYLSLLANPPQFSLVYPTVYDVSTFKAFINAGLDSTPDAFIGTGPSDDVGSVFIANSSKVKYFSTFNAATTNWSQWGAVVHFAQSEFDAGYAMGVNMRTVLNVSRAVCSVQTVGLQNLEDRCLGFAAGLFPGNTTKIYTPGTSNSPAVRQAVIDFISKPEGALIQGWQTLGADLGAYTAEALTSVGRRDVKVQSFDFSAAVAARILAGNITATVHQQPFVQAYFVLLYSFLAVLTGHPIATQSVLTGPAVVSTENIGPYLCEPTGYPVCPASTLVSVAPVSIVSLSLADALSIILPAVVGPVALVVLAAVGRNWFRRWQAVRYAPRDDKGKFCALFVGLKNEAQLWDRHASVMPAITERSAAIVRRAAKQNRCYEAMTIFGSTLVVSRDPDDGLRCAAAIAKELEAVPWDAMLDGDERRVLEAKQRPGGDQAADSGNPLSCVPASALGNSMGSSTVLPLVLRCEFGISVHWEMGRISYHPETPSYDYSGLCVDGAAQVADLCAGGQILVTDAVDRSAFSEGSDVADGTPFVEFIRLEVAKRDTTLYQFNVPGLEERAYPIPSTTGENADGLAAALEQARAEAVGMEDNTFRLRVCTVVFITCFDIRTSDREELSNVVRKLLDVVSDAATQHSGSVDSMDPSAVLLTFNAHRVCHSHEERAAKCVLAFRDALPPGYFVAVDTTSCCVGTVAARGRNSRVVLGEAVDVVRRLPGLMRSFLETNILFTERTARNISATLVRLGATDCVGPVWTQPMRRTHIVVCAIEESTNRDGGESLTHTNGDSQNGGNETGGTTNTHERFFREAFSLLSRGKSTAAERFLRSVIETKANDLPSEEVARLRRLLLAARNCSQLGQTGGGSSSPANNSSGGVRYVRSELSGWENAGAVPAAISIDESSAANARASAREATTTVRQEALVRKQLEAAAAALVVMAPVPDVDEGESLFPICLPPQVESQPAPSSAPPTSTAPIVPAPSSSSTLSGLASQSETPIQRLLPAPNSAGSPASFVPGASASTSISGGPTRTLIRDVSGQTWTRSRRPIAGGGFAAVYTGMSSTGAFCAIKSMDIRGRESIIVSLQAEVEVLTHLSHPNIVSYISCAHDESSFYILLEFLAGGSLRTVVETYGGLPPVVARRFAAAALEGMRYLHDNGVVHGDIKPDNILVGTEGVVKLTDFGSSVVFRATASGPVDSRESTGVFSGTSWYLAPELIRGGKPTPASDMWGFAITVLQLLKGELPWDMKRWTIDLMFLRDLDKDDTLLPEIPTGIPNDLRLMLEGCLERDPARRPTAGDILATHLAV